MKRCIPLAIAVVLGVSAERAEANPGLRFGLTDDPETVFVGFFYEATVTTLGRTGWFTIEPGADLGIDIQDNVDFLMIRGTFNFKFVFPLGQRAQIYPLLGLSLVHLSVDGPGDDTNAGLNFGGGMQFDRFSFELWGGFDHIPDITFLFGIAF